MVQGAASPVETHQRGGSQSSTREVESVREPRCSDTSVAVVLGYEHSLLRLVRTLLEELGIEAYKEERADDIVPTVARLRPCVIIIDVDFVHEAHTWTALRALKEDPGTREIPIVLCAAAPWLLDQQKGLLDRAAVRTWTEPYDLLELLRAIDSAVSKPSATWQDAQKVAEVQRWW
jgi:CheY-like chemotaxis protein